MSQLLNALKKLALDAAGTSILIELLERDDADSLDLTHVDAIAAKREVERILTEMEAAADVDYTETLNEQGEHEMSVLVYAAMFPDTSILERLIRLGNKENLPVELRYFRTRSQFFDINIKIYEELATPARESIDRRFTINNRDIAFFHAVKKRNLAAMDVLFSSFPSLEIKPVMLSFSIREAVKNNDIGTIQWLYDHGIQFEKLYIEIEYWDREDERELVKNLNILEYLCYYAPYQFILKFLEIIFYDPKLLDALTKDKIKQLNKLIDYNENMQGQEKSDLKKILRSNQQIAMPPEFVTRATEFIKEKLPTLPDKDVNKMFTMISKAIVDAIKNKMPNELKQLLDLMMLICYKTCDLKNENNLKVNHLKIERFLQKQVIESGAITDQETLNALERCMGYLCWTEYSKHDNQVKIAYDRAVLHWGRVKDPEGSMPALPLVTPQMGEQLLGSSSGVNIHRSRLTGIRYLYQVFSSDENAKRKLFQTIISGDADLLVKGKTSTEEQKRPEEQPPKKSSTDGLDDETPEVMYEYLGARFSQQEIDSFYAEKIKELQEKIKIFEQLGWNKLDEQMALLQRLILRDVIKEDDERLKLYGVLARLKVYCEETITSPVLEKNVKDALNKIVEHIKAKNQGVLGRLSSLFSQDAYSKVLNDMLIVIVNIRDQKPQPAQKTIVKEAIPGESEEKAVDIPVLMGKFMGDIQSKIRSLRKKEDVDTSDLVGVLDNLLLDLETPVRNVDSAGIGRVLESVKNALKVGRESHPKLAPEYRACSALVEPMFKQVKRWHQSASASTPRATF